MSFPTLVPSSRTFTPGNFPQRVFEAQSGLETRVLYGDKETKARLNLSYKNIADTSADDFVIHFRSVKGTYNTFQLNAVGNTNVKGGWTGDTDAIGKPSGTKWRYASAPRVTNVSPGVSSVQVNLIAVL